MIKNLKLELGSKIAIIGVLDTKEATKYDCLILQKRGKKLSVVEYKQQLSSLDEVKEITKKLPLILAFLGNKVLHTHENNLYLNNSSEEYYTTTYSAINGENFTSLVRKNYVNEVKETFQEKNFLIVDIFAGVLEINLLYKTFFQQKEVQVLDVVLKYDDKDCVAIKKTTPSFNEVTKINNESRRSLEMFLFAIGLSFYNENDRISRTQNDDELKKNKKEIHYKNQFELITKAGSILFAIVLMINFILSSYYSYKSDKLNNQIYFIKNKQMELNRLTIDKERKTKFIDISGFLNTNYISFYINEIATVTPNDITLSMIDALPNESKIINANQKITINDRMIKVTGVSRKNDAFNTWIDTLQTEEWVEKISITKYEQKDSYNTNFEIEMELK